MQAVEVLRLSNARISDDGAALVAPCLAQMLSLVVDLTSFEPISAGRQVSEAGTAIVRAAVHDVNMKVGEPEAAEIVVVGEQEFRVVAWQFLRQAVLDWVSQQRWLLASVGAVCIGVGVMAQQLWRR
jgi:hypothetical protein